MSSPEQNTWPGKFVNALRGIGFGMTGGRTNSFCVHLPAAICVLGGAWILGVSPVEWSILMLCIAVVIVAELFNSSLERLAMSITEDHNREIGEALDIASGAVLVASLSAAIIGGIVFLSAVTM